MADTNGQTTSSSRAVAKEMKNYQKDWEKKGASFNKNGEMTNRPTREMRADFESRIATTPAPKKEMGKAIVSAVAGSKASNEGQKPMAQKEISKPATKKAMILQKAKAMKSK